MDLHGKHILVGITGGIAAYKSADLIRRLRDAGAKVEVAMTRAAQEFITPLTLQAVSGRPVHGDLFDPQAEAAMGHIELARWADLILVAPASADFMARLCYGHASDLLSTLCLATTAPIVLVPAMNQQMWHHQVTQENVMRLKMQGVTLLGPGEGSQACGEVGPGRMLEPQQIITQLVGRADIAGKPTIAMQGLRILLTAGPTHEAIDPVRYLTNHSSGKMGYAIASVAHQLGAEVTLVSGPVPLPTPKGVMRVDVNTAMEMHQAVASRAAQCDIFIAAAAVADYRSEQVSPHKLAKNDQEINLKLVRNPDILATVASSSNAPFCVGFAAQTEEVIVKAKEKLVKKHLDMVIANKVGEGDIGFNSDNNEVDVLWPGGEKHLAKQAKQKLAYELITLIMERYQHGRKQDSAQAS